MAVIEMTPRLSSHLIDKWIRKEIDPIHRAAPLLGTLKAHGRISLNHDEADIRWRPRLKRRKPTTSPGYPHEAEFEAVVRHKNAVLPWRSAKLGEQIPKLETLIGRSKDTAFPDLVGNVIKWGLDDFQEWIQEALYYDGTGEDVHGIKSWFGATGTQTGVPVGTPSGTYAEISMVLGNTGLGGNWTAPTGKAWPVGSGDTEYCGWSPLTVLYDSSDLSTETTRTWATQWQEAMRYGITYLNSLQREKPNVAIWSPEMTRIAANSLKERQRLEVTGGSKLVDLGLRTYQFDGVEIVEDAFCPTATAYLLNTKRMNLWSLQSQLVAVERQKDIDVSTEKILLDSFLNMWVESPAYFAQLTTS